jgi:exopolyphosphatase/guanosine-5'-triphosphate,3'-diphosphate pyrophosphatase
MIRASIDIGTNSVLLLVADTTDSGLNVLHEEQHIPRLGQGVDESGALSDAAQNRVLDVLATYRSYLDRKYSSIVSKTLVTATSAVRDASNRKEFLKNIKEQTGWDVILLSGNEEAQVTYRGALSVIDIEKSGGANVVLDIGGGSTEIAIGSGKTLSEFVSLNMGSVRFTERFLKNDPPLPSEVEDTRHEIVRMLEEGAKVPASSENLIGVAGTLTSMAGLELELDRYDTSKINGHRCSRDFIEGKIEEFQKLTSEEIEQKYPVFLKGRGDVITAGLLILSEFMAWANFDNVVVSTGGIRHGILLEE